MQILSYSPQVEVYAAVSKGGSTSYYDLTPDVVQVSVGRRCDAASSFSAVLQNKGHKYNGLFGCMDRVVVYATKTERHKLFTGYITSFDAFKLYQTDFNISGLCSIYRLQKLYFDPYLHPSQQVQFANAFRNSSQDNGYAKVAQTLLTSIAGWPDYAIDIQEKIPQEAFDWACEMYAANAKSEAQLASMVAEFNEVLSTHGPKLSAGTSSGESGGLANLTGDEAKASEAQKEIVRKATDGSVPGTYFYCLKWVGDVYEAAGYPFERYSGAIDVWRNRASHAAYGSDMSKIPLGACIVTTGSGSDGYGHIGIYIGGGQVISEVGGQRTESLDSFGSWATDWIDGMQGTCGWICPQCGVTWK